MRHVYTVEYKRHEEDGTHTICLCARNKEDAYYTALYHRLDEEPYSMWVSSVTYDNGNYRIFKNNERKPF